MRISRGGGDLGAGGRLGIENSWIHRIFFSFLSSSPLFFAFCFSVAACARLA